MLINFLLFFFLSLLIFDARSAAAAPVGAVKDYQKLSATEGGLGVIPNQRNFGVSVAAADINGDGIKDYAVGEHPVLTAICATGPKPATVLGAAWPDLR